MRYTYEGDRFELRLWDEGSGVVFDHHTGDVFTLNRTGALVLPALYSGGSPSLSHGPRAASPGGIIAPTGIATDDTTKDFFRDLMDRQSLTGLSDLENRTGLSPAVHRSYKSCLLTVGQGVSRSRARFAFFLTEPRQIEEPRRVLTLSREYIGLLTPNTAMCPSW